MYIINDGKKVEVEFDHILQCWSVPNKQNRFNARLLESGDVEIVCRVEDHNTDLTPVNGELKEMTELDPHWFRFIICSEDTQAVMDKFKEALSV